MLLRRLHTAPVMQAGRPDMSAPGSRPLSYGVRLSVESSVVGLLALERCDDSQPSTMPARLSVVGFTPKSAGLGPEPPWSPSVAWHLSGAAFHEGDLCVMVDAYRDPLKSTVQNPNPGRRHVDTSRPAPGDLLTSDAAPPVGGVAVTVQARSWSC